MCSREGTSSKYSDAIFDILSCGNIDDVVKNIDNIISATIVLPHFVPLCKNTAIAKLKKLIMLIIEELNNVDSDEGNLSNSNISLYLSLLSLAMESLIHLKLDNLMELLAPEIVIKTLLKYSSSPHHISGLRALSFYISCDEKNEILPYCDSIKENLIANLLSPYHKVN